MSLKVVKNEICRFLSTDYPETLAIRGQWGIGKTHAWKQIIKEQKKSIKLKHYSYVSLFGVNSIQDLKQSLFQNLVTTSSIGENFNMANSIDYLSLLGRKSSKTFFQYISNLSAYTRSLPSVIDTLSFMTVRNSIICIDDFERKGSNLTTKEILGFLSELKEERQCKIVLIYNDEYIKSDLEDYNQLKEKVIDIEILYSPLPEESIDIAFSDLQQELQFISSYAKKLNISNIRILSKIKRLAIILNNLLSKYDRAILEQATQTLTLSCWSFYSKGNDIPPHEWIRKFNLATSYMVTESKSENKELETKWCATLQNYGYVNTDNFDKIIHNGVNDGYFDQVKLSIEADNLKKQLKQSNNSFKKAWNLFHEDLSDNQAAFIAELINSFKENYKYLSIIDLHSSVITLRKLNHSDDADTLIDFYIEQRKSECELFNLNNSLIIGQITDQIMIDKFDKIYQFALPPRTLVVTLSKLLETNSWNEDDVAFLKSQNADEYIAYFHAIKNPTLRKSIQICQFLKIDNAIEALRRIASESPYNALRLENYGIK